MNTFKLQCRKFELKARKHQLSTTCQHIVEEIFKTLETEDVCMPTSHSIIYPIANRNFGIRLFKKMDQTSVNMSTNLQINGINPDIFIDQ